MLPVGVVAARWPLPPPWVYARSVPRSRAGIEETFNAFLKRELRRRRRKRHWSDLTIVYTSLQSAYKIHVDLDLGETLSASGSPGCRASPQERHFSQTLMTPNSRDLAQLKKTAPAASKSMRCSHCSGSRRYGRSRTATSRAAAHRPGDWRWAIWSRSFAASSYCSWATASASCSANVCPTS